MRDRHFNLPCLLSIALTVNKFMAAHFYGKTFSNEPMKVWIAILVKSVISKQRILKGKRMRPLKVPQDAFKFFV
ncbi:hypothetical protein QQG55_4960 [Brugia pahangi]